MPLHISAVSSGFLDSCEAVWRYGIVHYDQKVFRDSKRSNRSLFFCLFFFGLIFANSPGEFGGALFGWKCPPWLMTQAI